MSWKDVIFICEKTFLSRSPFVYYQMTSLDVMIHRIIAYFDYAKAFWPYISQQFLSWGHLITFNVIILVYLICSIPTTLKIV